MSQWAEDQRALARTLGLSLEEWLALLRAAGGRSAGLTAAVIGAAVARGLGTSILDGLDGPALAERACRLIDPTPPRVQNPVLKEAVRRAHELDEGAGAARLRARGQALEAPRRGAEPLGESAAMPTPDAPGASRPSGGQG